MPRQPRHRRAPGSLEPGQTYHVTNRGVDRCPIFASDLDRIIFLSLLAEACLANGAVCHAFCLMTTHFHLVIEDTCGMLSQLMHHLEFCYARYFNDTRRRGGPLFESRFCAELMDSASYFQDAVAYVLLNPVRTTTPMAPSPHAYRWSTAALVCSDLTPAAFASALLAAAGGVETILAALPPSRLKTARDRRRTRLDALACGAWLDRDRVLAGRMPDTYRHILAARAGCEPVPVRDQIPRAIYPAAADPVIAERLEVRRPPFTGLDLDQALEAIVNTCRQIVPASLAASARCLTDITAYALWRFTSASADRIAAALGLRPDSVGAVVERMRRDREKDRAWQRLLWSIEWAGRWCLGAAPHRG